MKKGISLIVLVITIIVMIILAASVIIAMSNNGIIDRANQAVKLTDEKQVQDLAALAWAEAYLDEDRTDTMEKTVKDALKEQGVTDADWNIEVSDTGVKVTSKNNASGSNEQPKNTVTITISYESESTELTYVGTLYDIITVNGETYTELGTYEVPIGSVIECTISTRVLGYEHTITYNGTAVAGKNEPYSFTADSNVDISTWSYFGDSGIDILQNQ